MPSQPDFHWLFHTPLQEQTGEFVELVSRLGRDFDAALTAAPVPGGGLVLRAAFPGEPLAAEERGREFWLELHGQCLDHNLALELASEPPNAVWQPMQLVPHGPMAVSATPSGDAAIALQPGVAPSFAAGSARSSQSLTPLRPVIPAETLYDILRAGDPEMDRNLSDTIGWIESAGLPVINLLSYLDLPLFTAYAHDHPEEREQNLFLHMLHTWTCYRRFGEVHASIPEELALAFADPRYLRLNTTQFRSPAPALCLQLPDWSFPIRGARPQWAKEIYLTHLDPPTPADDRELTFMIVTCDQRGEFGFIPLEIPLSLPGVGQSIEAFFAPGAGDEELGANTEDLHRLVRIAATYCLYATAADRNLYLASPS